MKISPEKILIRELVDGYGKDEEGRVVGWGGKLDIRPPYQREYIHENNAEFKENLIKSVYFQRPINLIYFAKTGKETYELLDGQQRILTICKYVIEREFSIELEGKICYFGQLEAEENDNRIWDYSVHVHICEGEVKELMEWFRTINTGAHKLSDQELRNSLYNGPWVTDAKRWFTKKGGQAEMCARYMKGKRERQEHLEQIIKWKIGSTIHEDICSFMANHQHYQDASELWNYFKNIDEWILKWFDEHKSLIGGDWGRLYRDYKDQEYDPKHTRARAKELLEDHEVKATYGIYEYILSGETEEKFLNLRTFDKATKQKVWLAQEKKCKFCNKLLTLKDAHADHIKPWSENGATEQQNCQVLCVPCNLSKSNKE